jgi:hypothetical protein
VSRERRLLALAIVILLGLAGWFAAAGLGNGADDGTAAGRTTTTTTPTVPAGSAAVDAEIARIQTFVADARQRAFKADVPVTLLDGARFTERLLEDADEDQADIERAAKVLRALGLLDGDVDLAAVVRGFVGDAVAGFYDPEAGELVLRAASLTPYARSTLAHELTHALDDQWFDLDRDEHEQPGQDEALSAFDALVEGNAVRIQQRYEASMSRAERLQARLEESRLAAGVDLTGVPQVVVDVIAYPYLAGPRFAQAVADAGGEARIDEAFRHPPVTTEQIAHPDRFLAGAPVVAVPRPEADGPIFDQGLFGHASIVFTLQPVLGSATATRAADGWAGDGYVAWDAGGSRSCARVTFAMETPTDVDELHAALLRWAAERRGVDVDRQGETVEFTACG